MGGVYMVMLKVNRKNSREQLNDIGVDFEVVGDKFEKIQKELGFDKTRPMVLSTADQKDLDEKGDLFSSWYQEELLNLYESEDK